MSLRHARVGGPQKYTTDLVIELGIGKPDPYLQISEKVLQTFKDPELFSPFLSPIMFFSPGFSGTPAHYCTSIDSPEDQQNFGESIFFIGNVAMVLGSRA